MIFNLTSPVIRSKDHVPVLGEDFTYSGSCTVIDDSNDVEGVQWRIKFLTSGSLVVTKDWLVDLFLVGGGRSGDGGRPSFLSYARVGGNGGDGGQCKTIPSLPIKKGVSYPIVIGGSDGDTSALEQSTSGGGASGGKGGVYNNNGQGRGADGQSAGANTGGGGGGGGGGGATSSASSNINYGGSGGTGGSGIVIMRKHKGVAA